LVLFDNSGRKRLLHVKHKMACMLFPGMQHGAGKLHIDKRNETLLPWLKKSFSIQGELELMQRKLRYAVIGIAAGVFGMHQKALIPLRGEELELVAGSDVNVERGQQRADELHCAFYKDHRQMLAEEKPDVAVILAPHTFHTAIAIDCLSNGTHVLVEKPMALHVQDADKMIEAAAHYQRLLGVVFQHRFRPEVRAVRQLLDDGRLGSIQRVVLTAVWPRPTAYFKSAPWRGTWKGEGGGVLMNQGSHNLDLLCYLFGLPQRVSAWTRHLLHDIETEDTVQAMLEWSNGALGSVHISTAEVAEPERIEIVGSGGKIVFNRGNLDVKLLDEDFRQFAATAEAPFAPAPAFRPLSIELDEEPGDHRAVYHSFNEAIHQGRTGGFNTDGTQGRMELELANAMIYSSFTKSTVELPLDRERYVALLEDLREQKYS
jgi:predicted dehydrogenase